MNITLKVAVLRSGRRQNDIASECDITIVRFSKIVHDKAKATRDEKRRIAKALRRRIAEVFPDHRDVVTV